MQEGVAGQDSGHHKGCTLFASKMQAGQEGVDKELCTLHAAAVVVVNPHRTVRMTFRGLEIWDLEILSKGS
jgi:hypothetical protein